MTSLGGPFTTASAAVERGHESFQWVDCVGAAKPNGSPMQADVPFFIASIDKLLNATITLKV